MREAVQIACIHFRTTSHQIYKSYLLAVIIILLGEVLGSRFPIDLLAACPPSALDDHRGVELVWTSSN